MKLVKPVNPDALLPIDWASIELQYRAGIRSLRAIATEFGCTHAAIRKRAIRDGWTRDLKPLIHQLADQLVSKATVSAQVPIEIGATETAAVEASAMEESTVRLGHRATGNEAHKIGRDMLRALKLSMNAGELFKRVRQALESDAQMTAAQLQDIRNLASLVISLPGRVASFKTLVEALARTIQIERAAYGLDTASGTDVRPLVVIRDFTGRGSGLVAPQADD